MSTFEVAKLATDILLGGSLIYFCVRFLKPLGTDRYVRKIAELEGVIRNLIRDADDAGRSLNDELGRRQYALEKLLTDIRAADTAVQRTLTEASDKATTIARAIQQRASKPETAKPIYADSESERHWTTVDAEEVIEPPSFEAISPKRARKVQEQPAPEPPRLKASIEREVIEPETEHQEDLSDLEEIYKLAENLLRSGRDLEFISARTNLPVDQLEIIAESISRTQPTQGQGASGGGGKDSRLGVLGGFSREVRTV